MIIASHRPQKITMAYQKTIICLLIGFSSVFNAAGFSVHSTQRRQSAPLRVSRIDESKQQPKWIDLPRARGDLSQLPNVEIKIGRVAMVGFLGLLAGEIISGESFGQQIVAAVMLAGGN
jgi:hypothetical protein